MEKVSNMKNVLVMLLALLAFFFNSSSVKGNPFDSNKDILLRSVLSFTHLDHVQTFV
ncbi:MAG: hypothetical protein HQM10_09870 [Candidatus Riflebacteria bacterium]|nr:hypothetical protein [Candidatus Riflebacteria bacterium]